MRQLPRSRLFGLGQGIMGAAVVIMLGLAGFYLVEWVDRQRGFIFLRVGARLLRATQERLELRLAIEVRLR